MKIHITNSRDTRRGTGVNFNHNEQWYSVQKKIIIEKTGQEYLEGMTIEITDFHESSSWIMIDDFKLIKFNNDIENIDISNFKPHKKIEHSTFKNIQEQNIESLDLFSPFELPNIKFGSSTRTASYEIEEVLEIKQININKNSHISLMQNFVSRGSGVDLIGGHVESLIFNLILDIFKRDYKSDEVKLKLPSYFKNYIDGTINEINELIKIFQKITKKFPEDLVNFIENLDFHFQNEKQQIEVLNNDKRFLLINIIQDKEEYPIPCFIATQNVEYKKLSDFPKEINTLLKLTFYNEETKISKLKNEQIKALELLVSKQQNILAVLKTGFGKSLIYQFASILQPRVFLNIFPINSLIKDQSISLQEEFNLSYIIDNEKLKKINPQNLYKELLSTKRMFLVTPERLENQAMQNYFSSLNKMIGFMIFDEAHCISEWGHDFRPSYLMARHLMDNLIKTNDLQVIALTATAAPHIQKDIASLLSIKKSNIINIADSSGLDRKEIQYKIIKKEIDDFDRMNNSYQYAEVIDKHITQAMNSHKQGIAFFMKSGNDRDLQSDRFGEEKYLRKNNAFSAFERSFQKTNVGLYTGKNKIIGHARINIPTNEFHEFQKLDFIFATKSFGMGVNLKKCDYVLLTEPPYSLEDLYQQSGRVGRMGQDSIVEILYHYRSVQDPLNALSPYRFFLQIDKKRQDGQLNTVFKLIEAIYNNDGPFELNLSSFFDKFDYANQDYLKWSISHLITEFNLIDKYYVKYGGSLLIRTVGIFPKSLPSKEELLEQLNQKNKNLGMEHKSLDILNALNTYYEYYFSKLQNDKLIGINILREKLNNIDQGLTDGSKLISEALTAYYKTRLDKVDLVAQEIIDKLISETDLEDLIKWLKIESGALDTFELIESISRSSINNTYIEIASLLMNYLFNESILISNLKNITLNSYDEEYLEATKNTIIFKLFFELERTDEEWVSTKAELVKKTKWKKINELIIKNKIMEDLNG